MIDPERIRSELVEAGAVAVLRENGIEPDGYEGPAYTSARTAVAAFLNALIENEEARRRARRELLLSPGSDLAKDFMAALVAAVTEPER